MRRRRLEAQSRARAEGTGQKAREMGIKLRVRIAGSGDTHAKLDAHLARFLPGALRSRPRLCFEATTTHLQRRPRPISRGKR